MKIKFLNQIIQINQSDRPLPSPYYDVNYSYKVIYISSHVDMSKNADKELLNNIILRGCIDITRKIYCGLGVTENPIYDYLLSKVNILDDVYDISNGKNVKPFKEVTNNGKRRNCKE